MPVDLPERHSVTQVPPNSERTVRLPQFLALLAVLTLEAGGAEGERTIATMIGLVSGEAGAMWLISRVARRLDRAAFSESVSRPLLILTLAVGAFVVELMVRLFGEFPLPIELLVLSLFRNGVLALAAFAHRSELQRMSCSLSTFLMIFAAALSGRTWLQGVVVLFAMTGVWWLVDSYWNSLRGRLASVSSRDLPRHWWIGLPLLIVVALVLLPVAARQTHALQGFMPTSGGTGQYREDARSGINDGDALVAGTDNIRSFAPIEDAPFLNSHEPSLYDVFDDMYDEPAKPTKIDRAIALPRQMASTQKEHDLAQSLRAGREFATVRKLSRPKSGSPGDRDSNALMYVKGRVPLHLKLEVFDRYDGVEWFPEELPAIPQKLVIERLHDRPWLRVERVHGPDLYSLPETHTLKIIRLDTNRIPTPSQFLRLHIDQVDRADMFGWAQPTVLKMERKKLPRMAVLHLQSRVVDERLTIAGLLTPWVGSEQYRQFGDDPQSQRVRELAATWTEGVPTGWRQIQAIVSNLRQQYIHDRGTKPPLECRHTVADFLFESRRGPDYQFASAAVWLLRSRGYGARLVSGFYVEPSRYESRSEHTPVLKEDVHFWAEVSAGRDQWIPIEPTPGYELLAPPPTLSDRLSQSFWSLLMLIWRNAALVAPGGIALVWLAVERRRVADLLATAFWCLWPDRGDRVLVRRTLRLLEARCRRAGLSRPLGMSSSRWLTRIAQRATAGPSDDLLEFSRLTEWACFAPTELPPPHAAPAQICRRAERSWRWRSISGILRTPQTTPEHQKHFTEVRHSLRRESTSR